jgi:hypothetical protein
VTELSLKTADNPLPSTALLLGQDRIDFFLHRLKLRFYLRPCCLADCVKLLHSRADNASNCVRLIGCEL